MYFGKLTYAQTPMNHARRKKTSSNGIQIGYVETENWNRERFAVQNKQQ